MNTPCVTGTKTIFFIIINGVPTITMTWHTNTQGLGIIKNTRVVYLLTLYSVHLNFIIKILINYNQLTTYSFETRFLCIETV